jgi:hypothetical protein
MCCWQSPAGDTVHYFVRYLPFLLLAMFLALTPAFSSSAATSGEDGKDVQESGKPLPRLSSARFFKLKPFTLPVLYKGEIEEHFTLVLSLELFDEDDRDKVRHRIPRIRNEFYRALLSIVTFRRTGAPIPDIEIFRSRLLRILKKLYGEELVRDLLIQQAFKQSVR